MEAHVLIKTLLGHKIASVAVGGVLYVLGLVVYRLYLSPLAGIPGPRLAAITSLYHFYYDVIKRGKYVWEVEKMHREYGPIVRIRPEVIHINDPSYIDVIYAGAGHRRNRYKLIARSFGSTGAVLATIDHEVHRKRRAAINPAFSKQSIRRLEPITNSTLQGLLSLMTTWSKRGEPIPLNLFFKATARDIITEYAFGEGVLGKALEMDDLNAPIFAISTPSVRVCLAQFWWWIVPLGKRLPAAIITRIDPNIFKFKAYQEVLAKKVEAVRKEKNDEGTTIFHTILKANIPDSEKETERLKEEAYILVVAGTDTTAGTMASLTYHMLSNPDKLKKLKKELEEAIPNPDIFPDATILEALPYLTAIISEGLRLHPGVSLRMERSAPDEDLIYTSPEKSLGTAANGGKTYTIPAGTPMSMSAPVLGRNTDLYPDPMVFRPERYLEDPKLTKYLISFSRGTRQCLGINLAYQEMYKILGGIFRKYDLYDPAKGEKGQGGPTLELFQTTREDVDFVSDFVTPGLKPGSHGVRLVVRED